MRYLILSDVHANRQALNAVMIDARRIGFDAVLVLGDLVGYGGDPAAVIDEVLALAPLAIVRGNHDKVCAGLEPPGDFNDSARVSAEWTRRALDERQTEALKALPRGPLTVSADVEICHGAPFDEDYYVVDGDDASRSAAAASTRLCLFGHTHVPAIFAPAGALGRIDAFEDDPVRLPSAGPILVNVGSVGQPRDGNPRAAYGLLDETRGTVWFRRVAYDVAGAQASILRARLPDWLAARLALGR